MSSSCFLLWYSNRAAWLQGRWLEISEQERRAQIHNQKLLQDFQRAQDTLDDMLARTEAMNNIRVSNHTGLPTIPPLQQPANHMKSQLANDHNPINSQRTKSSPALHFVFFLKTKWFITVWHCMFMIIFCCWINLHICSSKGSVWTVSGRELPTMAEKTERHKSCWKVQGAFLKGKWCV